MLSLAVNPRHDWRGQIMTDDIIECDPDQAKPESADTAKGSATHFVFDHKIFSVNGARFALTGSDHEPALMINVGEHEAAITFSSLCQEFEIEPDSNDQKMLEKVQAGLKYVKDIRPGDTIPRELLDGSASWSIDERHKSRARNRLMFEIAAIGSEGQLNNIPDDLASFLDLTESKMWVQSGLDKIGKSIGLGPGRANSVTEMAERISRELAYIEALRDRYICVSQIVGKLKRVASAHHSERHFVDEIQRCIILMGPPVADFRGIFRLADERSRDVVKLLKDIDQNVSFARELRDELHQKMLIWDELIESWEIDVSTPSKVNREAVKFTYRFVAHNFPQKQDWM